MLIAAKECYDDLNIMSPIQNTILSTTFLMGQHQRLVVRDNMRRAGRPPAATWVQRVHNGVVDAGQRAGSRVPQFFAGELLSRRYVPPFCFLGLVMPGILSVSALYPLGELIFGRGHRPFTDLDEFAVGRFIGRFDVLMHYGLLGAVLEAAPRAMSQRFEARGKRRMAAACMVGAVCGRAVLQMPRVLCTLAALLEVSIAVAILSAGYLLAQPLVCGAEAIARYVWNLCVLGVAGGPPAAPLVFPIGPEFQAAVANARPRLSDDDRVIDPGGVGAQERVAQRFEAMLVRFNGLVDNTATAGARITERAEGIARDLRRFCSLHADDNVALRYGLRRLKDYIDNRWAPQIGVVFNPPELHGPIDEVPADARLMSA